MFSNTSPNILRTTVFDGAMNDLSRNDGPLVVEAYDFGRFSKIVDAEGGHRALLMSILRRYPRPHGVVFDLPQVVTGAQAAIAAAGLSEQCEAVAGDISGNQSSFGKPLDLQMLVMGGGRERTREEFQDLLEAGGFRLPGISATATMQSVIEGVPV